MVMQSKANKVKHSADSSTIGYFASSIGFQVKSHHISIAN